MPIVSKDGQTSQLKIGKELLDGFVSIKFPDQADFAGTYLEGFRNGEGVFRYPDGSEYKGIFKDCVIVWINRSVVNCFREHLL